MFPNTLAVGRMGKSLQREMVYFSGTHRPSTPPPVAQPSPMQPGFVFLLLFEVSQIGSPSKRLLLQGGLGETRAIVHRGELLSHSVPMNLGNRNK